ncbi:hypothetical protein [Pseudarthrobacter chlorophenolicus]|uniref:hypothetical protein n=1 Tax=Pseudarthrobacter chlorophenolicus TaxID=85085 RepID=UPI00031F1A3C|nr:hypothetical protein [Pseudarthrobacter chlorophenolicus]
MQLTSLSTDSECHDILQRHADGLIDGTEARRLIAESLHRSGIASAVAREKTVIGVQLMQDLATEMEELLFQKVMQTEPGGFDLDLGLEASATGWARQLLRAGRLSMIRNIQTRTTSKMTLVDPSPMRQWQESGWVAGPYTAFHTATTSDRIDPQNLSQTMEDAADWLRSKTRHLRDSSKLAAQAATIMHAYGVPALVRPRIQERKRLKAMIDAEPGLAHRSIAAMRALIEGEPYEVIDSGLMALWDDYSFEQIDNITRAAPRVAGVLVDSVLADRARPSRTVLRSFRASVRAMGKGRGWARLAEEVCEAFIALEFEAYSSFDTTGADYREERVAGRRIACLKAPDVFARALAFKGQRLGLNEADLYDQLDRLIRSLTDLEVKVPEAA